MSAADLVAKLRARAARERLEKALEFQLRALELTDGMLREYQFDRSGRRWRLDFAWPAVLLGVEVEGVTGGAGGRHQRKRGFENDCEKYNAAALDGWCVLRFPGKAVEDGSALETIERALELRTWYGDGGADRDPPLLFGRAWR